MSDLPGYEAVRLPGDGPTERHVVKWLPYGYVEHLERIVRDLAEAAPRNDSIYCACCGEFDPDDPFKCNHEICEPTCPWRRAVEWVAEYPEERTRNWVDDAELGTCDVCGIDNIEVLDGICSRCSEQIHEEP